MPSQTTTILSGTIPADPAVLVTILDRLRLQQVNIRRLELLAGLNNATVYHLCLEVDSPSDSDNLALSDYEPQLFPLPQSY